MNTSISQGSSRGTSQPHCITHRKHTRYTCHQLAISMKLRLCMGSGRFISKEIITKLIRTKDSNALINSNKKAVHTENKPPSTGTQILSEAFPLLQF